MTFRYDMYIHTLAIIMSTSFNKSVALIFLYLCGFVFDFICPIYLHILRVYSHLSCLMSFFGLDQVKQTTTVKVPKTTLTYMHVH